MKKLFAFFEAPRHYPKAVIRSWSWTLGFRVPPRLP
jgi:hypothetical protein